MNALFDKRLLALGLVGTLVLSGCTGASPNYRRAGAPVRMAVQPNQTVNNTPASTSTTNKRLEAMEKQLSALSAAKDSRGPRASFSRRLALMEKEIASLRGDLEVVRHENKQLKEELNAMQQMADQAPAPSITSSSKPASTRSAPSSQRSLDGMAQSSAKPGSAPTSTGEPKPALQTATQLTKSDPAPSAESEKPTSAKKAYDDAFLLLKSRQFNQASAAFTKFIQWFPKHELTDNAQYWIGEIHYVQRRFPEALVAFNDVLVQWPDSDKVPGSLLKIGFAFFELEDTENGYATLRRLIKDHPDSPAVHQARQRIEEMDAKAGR